MAVAEAPLRAAESLRTRLTAIAPELAEDAEEALREALRTTKRVRVQRDCVKCGCNHVDTVEVADSVAQLNAVKLALEQTEGRPGVAEQDQAEALQVARTVGLSINATHALALLDAGELDALRAELASSLPLD